MSASDHSLDGWREEMRSAYLYRVMAEAESGTPRAELFRGLAVEAENQARSGRVKPGPRRPSTHPTCARAWSLRWCAATARVPCARCWWR